MHVATFTYRAILKLSSLFTFNRNIHNNNTRQTVQLHIPNFNTTFVQNSLRYRAIILWNSLPHDIISNRNVHAFKEIFVNITSIPINSTFYICVYMCIMYNVYLFYFMFRE